MVVLTLTAAPRAECPATTQAEPWLLRPPCHQRQGHVIPPGCNFLGMGPLGTLALSPEWGQGTCHSAITPSSHQASWSGWPAGS